MFRHEIILTLAASEPLRMLLFPYVAELLAYVRVGQTSNSVWIVDVVKDICRRLKCTF